MVLPYDFPYKCGAKSKSFKDFDNLCENPNLTKGVKT